MIKNWIGDNLITNKKLVSKRCKPEWFIKNNHAVVYDEILLNSNGGLIVETIVIILIVITYLIF